MNALLPEDLESSVLSMMGVGDSGYTVPWAMWVDAQRRCWLHPKYTLRDKQGGTCQMRVTLTGDGYVATITDVRDYTWQPSKSPGYFGEGCEWLPVVRLVR